MVPPSLPAPAGSSLRCRVTSQHDALFFLERPQRWGSTLGPGRAICRGKGGCGGPRCWHPPAQPKGRLPRETEPSRNNVIHFLLRNNYYHCRKVELGSREAAVFTKRLRFFPLFKRRWFVLKKILFLPAVQKSRRMAGQRIYSALPKARRGQSAFAQPRTPGQPSRSPLRAHPFKRQRVPPEASSILG